MNPVSNEDCGPHFKKAGTIADEEFCTAIDAEHRILECILPSRKEILSAALCSPTCQQNHGEAMLHFINQQGKISAVVVGLSSATNSCDLNKPLVFTRVSAYKEWIEAVLSA
jgi:hypothetical protein